MVKIVCGCLGRTQRGRKAFIETIKTKLSQAMVLAGTQRADQVNESILFRA
ncbi:hypothetical protein [uncultured Desulfobacter sp.]|uniref:hypothetical protein n=1 Tax=uncultured Desulfobacter sp. TaxID=240139 RepID=UPI0029F5B55D|nr:hypothetical protein [uncultured Desulfobacter sp.]